jgi:hypothetical protein
MPARTRVETSPGRRTVLSLQQQAPPRWAGRFLDIGSQRNIGAHVQRGDVGDAVGSHHIGGQVVDQRAIDMHLPFCSTGGSTPGIALDARSHSHSGPWRCTACRRRTSGWTRRSRADADLRYPVRRTCDAACARRGGRGSAPAAAPSSPTAGVLRTKARRKFSVIVSISQPFATPAPMIAPMLVPPTASNACPASRSARSAPRCASPRAPPPASTSPRPWPLTSRANRTMSALPQMMVMLQLAAEYGTPALRRAQRMT